MLITGKETPNNLRVKVNVSIGSTAFVLVGEDNISELLRAGLDDLKSIVNMYPETLEVLAAVQVTRIHQWQQSNISLSVCIVHAYHTVCVVVSVDLR